MFKIVEKFFSLFATPYVGPQHWLAVWMLLLIAKKSEQLFEKYWLLDKLAPHYH